MFLIESASGEAIGHIGLLVTSQGIEVDNVARGSSSVPGVMTDAMEALEQFTYLELGYETIYLKVLESNTHARRFYSRLGYLETERIPLSKREESDKIQLIEDPDGIDDSFVVCTKNLSESRSDCERVLTAGPSIGPRERHYVYDAVSNGWNDKHNEYISTFESRFAQNLGVKHAIATSSCTGALHLALLAAGIGVDDEVIVPEITWIATAAAVKYCGATPVFVAVDSDTWCLSPEATRKAISSRTRAIIPVHLYGNPADMTSIMAIAREHDLKVIEDAAPAIGASHLDRYVGTFGDLGCFSFQGAKLMVTGEGGMVVTDNDELAYRVRKILDHGRRPGTFWIDEIGVKYKMTNLSAALGLGQLEKLFLQISQKRRINSWYRSVLESAPQIVFQNEHPSSRSIYWMTSICLTDNTTVTREELFAALQDWGIDSRPAFPCLSQFSLWNRRSVVDPDSAMIGTRGVNLPSGVALSKATVERVAQSVLKILSR